MTAGLPASAPPRDPDTVTIRGMSLGPKGSLRPDGEIALPASLVRRLGVAPEDLRWHRVDGSAMSPTLSDGDLVVVALDAVPRDGGVHLLAANGGVAARRLRALASGGWVASCDSPGIAGEERSPSIPVVGSVVLRIGPP